MALCAKRMMICGLCDGLLRVAEWLDLGLISQKRLEFTSIDGSWCATLFQGVTCKEGGASRLKTDYEAVLHDVYEYCGNVLSSYFWLQSIMATQGVTALVVGRRVKVFRIQFCGSRLSKNIRDRKVTIVVASYTWY
jgi:hypothetical protein